MSYKIGIILGSTRSNSLGSKIMDYLKNTFKSTEEVEYTWISLKDYPLPLYDHEETPLSERIQGLNDAESKWLSVIAEQDGYIMMTPEYDHAITGAFKNALDYIGPEVDHKPVQIISYSHFSDGGMLAAESIVEILQMLKMMVLPEPVLIWNADPNFVDDGKLDMSVENSDHFAARFQDAFKDIEFYIRVLKDNPFNRE
ncbi:NADPH-dependent oxidoreductase [Lentilactobacillus curieae]|uniref:NADPH-dependent oxidoreductase n=1 Tax=Lentilactobacillus curieae TaxID=1138822 RepID=A0A1S6QHA8_9LACO|nr:NAD(P)H-dependent oxidoreductase [Lentilactobacillus curieae]AQW20979.1 NADPH-dependent oxidoreductase [Lentilactobacillus curieae]